MSLWDALRMNMMISYQELVRTFPRETHDVLTGSDDGRHSNTSLAWGAGVQFNPTESVPLILLMKAPAVATGALTVSSWVSVISSD